MIVVRLCGGLGNQLFQYAAGRHLAHIHETELVLDIEWYKKIPKFNTPRNFELDHYRISARKVSKDEEWPCKWHSDRLLRRVPLVPRRWASLRENGFEFDRAVLMAPDNVYLNGYWQSHLYFEGIAEVIRREVIPKPELLVQHAEMERTIREKNSVSIHVRRGDYVIQKAAAAVHGVCSLDYYQLAMEKIVSLVPSAHFFVFSDDLEWSRQNIKPTRPVTFVDKTGPASAILDLHLMSQCKHQIIANSSFSWWGAWLNPNAHKCVVAPRKWFSSGRPTATLIPTSWVRL